MTIKPNTYTTLLIIILLMQVIPAQTVQGLTIKLDGSDYTVHDEYIIVATIEDQIITINKYNTIDLTRETFTIETNVPARILDVKYINNTIHILSHTNILNKTIIIKYEINTSSDSVKTVAIDLDKLLDKHQRPIVAGTIYNKDIIILYSVGSIIEINITSKTLVNEYNTVNYTNIIIDETLENTYAIYTQDNSTVIYYIKNGKFYRIKYDGIILDIDDNGVYAAKYIGNSSQIINVSSNEIEFTVKGIITSVYYHSDIIIFYDLSYNGTITLLMYNTTSKEHKLVYPHRNQIIDITPASGGKLILVYSNKTIEVASLDKLIANAIPIINSTKINRDNINNSNGWEAGAGGQPVNRLETYLKVTSILLTIVIVLLVLNIVGVIRFPRRQ